MATKCILDSATKVVVNIIELDDDTKWNLVDGTELALNHSGDIGDTWDGTKFVKPTPSESIQAPKPTKEQLMSELATLTAKIQALE